MKKIILTMILLVAGNFVFAACGCEKQTKCLDLMTNMYNERATLYNVLNLSADQQKCRDVIDAKRYEELGVQFRQYEQEKYVFIRMSEHEVSKSALKKQEKVVKNIEKCMQQITAKYDKEFNSILNSEQRAKLRTIRSMEKKEIKRCEKNKSLYKPDKNLRPFGEGMYGKDEKLCPIHNKWHMFGFKHKNK